MATNLVRIEKQSRMLPQIRITESLELRLMRLAAADNRSLSDYVRNVLFRHVFGHVSSVIDDEETDK